MEALEKSIEVKVNDGKRRREVSESEPKKPRKKRTSSEASNEDLPLPSSNVE